MRYGSNLPGSAVLLFAPVLGGGVLWLLSERGELPMGKTAFGAGEAAAKPAIDSSVPKAIETATFALG